MAWLFNDEDKDKLVSAFESLEVKPDMDDPEALKRWISRFAKGQDRIESKNEAPGTSKSMGEHTHVVYTPKVSIFSGGTDTKDVSYEMWRFEVRTLLQEKVHSVVVITTAAKKSLRGEAAKAVRRLGVLADIYEILDKFDGLYGLIEDTENLLTDFYNAKQDPEESVTTWGCRLEDLLYRAVEDESISLSSVNDMLRTKFWNGLLPYLKEPLRPKKDSIHNFDKFRIEARKIEKELGGIISKSHDKGKKTHVKSITVDSKGKNSEYTELKGMVLAIGTRLDSLETSVKASSRDASGKSSFEHPQNQNISIGSAARGSASRGQGRGQYHVRGRGRGRFTNNRGSYPHGNQRRIMEDTLSPNQSGNGFNHSNTRQDVICYRCGQPGHLSYGCRVDIHLNGGESA